MLSWPLLFPDRYMGCYYNLKNRDFKVVTGTLNAPQLSEDTLKCQKCNTLGNVYLPIFHSS